MPETMTPGATTKVKVCGLVRPDDARHAAAAGADFLGAILSPGYSRSVSPETARTFAEPEGPALVAVLVNETLDAAVAAARAAGASVLQLHGDEDPHLLDELGDAGAWSVWKALRPRSEDDLRRGIERYADHADGLLLDGWHASAPGGTGARVSWRLVEALRDELPSGTLLVLAGGLTPDSVGDAVARLSPHVVDVSSGVETAVGEKDPERVRRFIAEARRGGFGEEGS